MAFFSQLSDEQKNELWSCLALRHSKGLGVQSANTLIGHYGSAFQAVELGLRAPGCWVSDELLTERAARSFAKEDWRIRAKEEWGLLQRPGVEFIYRTHPAYPPLLGSIPDAPLVLYYRGDIRLLLNPMVGVVGSRHCSPEGILTCGILSRQLASFGITIVSGMARGIDRVAHIAGLSSLGSSVAVLGTGIDVVYPEGNHDVFASLLDGGLIISEFMPGTAPFPKNFPIRNRVISGLARGVLIVEATKRSGSLITARLALEQGRDVFAVPGSSFAKGSEGCHGLIRSGAKPVFSAEDIVMDLAPLLTVDVNKQLAMLFEEGQPGSLEQLACVTGSGRELPPLYESGNDSDRNHYKRTVAGLPVSQLARRKADEADERLTRRHARGGNPADNAVSYSGICAIGGGSIFEESGGENQLSEFERQLLVSLKDDWRHIDWLSEHFAVDAGAMSSALTLLEVSGLVVQRPGMLYRLA